MNITPTARVGELQRSVGSANQIGRTQVALAQASERLSTGKQVIRPSDAPGDAGASLQIRRNLELDVGYDRSLAHADRMLSRTDNALGELTELIREARQIGLANTGDQATQDERDGAATVLRTLERQMLAIANTVEGGIALFGGDNGTTEPFTAAAGGIRFNGGDDAPAGRIDGTGRGIDFLAKPSDVFGGNSRRVGTADLDPVVTAATRLSELAGARGQGVERGSIRITNAGATAIVDLSDADTVGDIMSRIDASGIGVTTSLSATPGNITINGGSVTVGELGQATAADLGLVQTTPSATVAGAGLDRTITPQTPLADLNGGAGTPTGTFTINNGATATTIDTSGLTTVEDLLNVVNASGVGVDATISDDGTRLLLRNAVQGTAMTVSDTSGTAAEQLGWLTFTEQDALSEFNGGRGVRLDGNGADLRFVDPANVSFEVDLSGAAAAVDVIAAINTAAAAAGASTVASFDPAAPGFVLTNVTTASTVGDSQALVDLGLDNAAAANTITGRDVNAVAIDGPFSHLRSLISGLTLGNFAEAQQALERLEASEQQAISTRGEVGGRLQEVEQRRTRLADGEVVQLELLSRIEDIDYAQAVTEYQSLQTSLQAQLQATSRLLGQSLFDYLR